MSNFPSFILFNVKDGHWGTSLPTQTSGVTPPWDQSPEGTENDFSNPSPLTGSDSQGNNSHPSFLPVGLRCSQKHHKPPLGRNMQRCRWELQLVPWGLFETGINGADTDNRFRAVSSDNDIWDLNIN